MGISMKSTRSNNIERAGDNPKDCWLRVGIFQVVPWYVKVYYHAMEMFLDGESQPIMNSIEKIGVSPSEDKVSPGVMEIILRLPCSVRTAALTLEFDKGFLHIDEYPPDANQGFDIPSAVVHFTDFFSNMSFHDDSFQEVPLLFRLQEEVPVLSYTEVLLVPLTTPDFSMCYNVITITCTVFALYFGSLLNALRRRIGEEERLPKGNAKSVDPDAVKIVCEAAWEAMGAPKVIAPFKICHKLQAHDKSCYRRRWCHRLAVLLSMIVERKGIQ